MAFCDDCKNEHECTQADRDMSDDFLLCYRTINFNIPPAGVGNMTKTDESNWFKEKEHLLKEIKKRFLWAREKFQKTNSSENRLYWEGSSDALDCAYSILCGMTHGVLIDIANPFTEVK